MIRNRQTIIFKRKLRRIKRRLITLKARLKNHKTELIAIIGVVLFLMLLTASYQQGAKGFGTNGREEEELDGEAPKALETSFERWYRGEDDQLLASFFLFNHSDQPVEQVEILCATFLASGEQIRTYRRVVGVTLMPGEVRHLSRTRIGELDPLAQKANCRINSWK